MYPGPERSRPAGRLLLALLTVVVAALVGACDPGPGTSTPTTGPSGGRLVVGSIASATGSASAYGASQLQGTRLALDDLAAAAGVGAELLDVDDRSTPEGGVAAMRDLLDRGAAVVLGPTLSPVAEAADPLAQEAGVPVLAVTNTTLDIAAIGDVVWRVSLSEAAMIPQAVAATRAATPFDTAALVYDETDGYALGAAQAFRDAAGAQGVRLVADVAFAPGSGGAAGALVAATADQPGAVLFAARSAAAIELLLATGEVPVPAARVGGNGFNSPEVLDGAGATAEGLVVAASWNAALDDPGNQAFVRRYQERFGQVPVSFAAQGYAGVQLLLAAVQAGGGTSPEQVRAGLARVGEVATVLGPVRFAGHEADYRAAVQVVRAGRFALLGR